jgi:hypothetical protein
MGKAIEALASGEFYDVIQPGIAFLELSQGRCKFPFGRQDEPATRFCGANTPPGSPYCLKCRGIVYASRRARPPSRLNKEGVGVRSRAS